MIEFTDSFSQAAVAEACLAFPELLQRLSLELTLPLFIRPLDDRGRIAGPAQVDPPQSLRKTLLFVSSRDMVEHLPKEIGFCRYLKHCDQYGTPHGEWRMILNGIYYNHGDNRHSQWSCHT